MPLASEKAREGGGSSTPEITAPGIYRLQAAYVSEEKSIKSGENAGKPLYSVCWEDVEGGGHVWDNLAVIEPAWPRMAKLWLALGNEDQNFDSVGETAEALLFSLDAKPIVFAECGMGKASPGYPAKMEIKWFYLPEEGAAKLAAGPVRRETDDDEVPF